MDDKSIISQISIIENLIWKIRGRNFPILLYILKVFEEIKMPFKKNEEIFKLGYKNIYNIKYYNKRKLLEIKFEVFKILVNQILNKIKDILKDKEDIENDLTIERNPSKVSDTDFKELFKIIISYFIDINPESYYYYDINLFFYKIFSNSKILLRLLLSLTPNALMKITKISFYEEIKIMKKII